MLYFSQFQNLIYIIIGVFLGSWQSWRQQNIRHTQGHHGRIYFKQPTHYLVPKKCCLHAITFYILFSFPYLLLSTPNQHIFFIKSDNIVIQENCCFCFSPRHSNGDKICPPAQNNQVSKRDKTYGTTVFRMPSIRKGK